MNLPVTLLAYALSNKIVNQLKLFLYLKTICSGHFKIGQGMVKETCTRLGYKSQKTFYKNLSWLVSSRWVTINSKSQSYRLISLNRLCHKLNLKTKTGVLFDNNDFKMFRPFLYASVIAWSIRRKIWLQLQRQPERKKGRSRKSMSKLLSQMPNRYLGKILQLDHSTISRYRKSAVTTGLVTSKHRFKDTGLPVKFRYLLEKAYPDEAHLFVVHNNTIQQQLPDSVSSLITLKPRRNRPP